MCGSSSLATFQIRFILRKRLLIHTDIPKPIFQVYKNQSTQNLTSNSAKKSLLLILIKSPSISTWQNEKFTSSLPFPIQVFPFLCHHFLKQGKGLAINDSQHTTQPSNKIALGFTLHANIVLLNSEHALY